MKIVSKKLLIVGLSVLMLLTPVLSACSSKAGTTPTAPAGYKEQPVPLPEGVKTAYTLQMDKDGSLWLVGKDASGQTVGAWQLQADDTWTLKLDLKELLSLGDSSHLVSASFTPEGKLLIGKRDGDDPAAKASYHLVSLDGQVEDSPESAPTEDDSASSLEAEVSSGTVQSSSSAPESEFVDYKGNRVVLVPNPNGDSGLVYEPRTYDGKTGNLADNDPELEAALKKVLGEHASSGITHPFLAQNPLNPDELLLYTSQGVYYYKSGEFAHLVIARDSALNNPDFIPGFCLAKDDSMIYVGGSNLHGDMTFKLYRYVPNDGTGSDAPKKTIRIYALTDNAAVRQAIALYREANPTVNVELEVGLTGKDATTANDALHTLNTKILAGEGPDIILLDGMPIDAYKTQGLLADLSELYAELTASGNYFDNILGAYTDESGTYALPARFAFPALFAKSATADGVDSLAALVAAAKARAAAEPGGAVFSNANQKRYLYTASYPAIFGNGKQLDEAALREFLEQTKALKEASDTGVVVTTLGGPGGGSDEDGNGSENGFTLVGNPGMLSLGNALSPSEFGMIELVRAITGEDLTYKPLSFGGTKTFEPGTVMGVNAKSKDIDAAKDFLRFMLSEGIQGTDQGTGLPVSSAAFAAALEQSKELGTDFVDERGKAHDYSNDTFVKPTVDDYVALIKSLDTAISDDLVVRDIIFSQLQAYLNGTASLDDTVKNISQKLNLYLAE
jgi:ABC-type glycerol-3-phosphate transport system substrate-binding protein